MPLSEWPEKFRDDDDREAELAEAFFEEEVFVVAETEKAYGFSVEERGKVEIWMPKSQVEDNLEVGYIVDSVTIPVWLAKERDMEYDLL